MRSDNFQEKIRSTVKSFVEGKWAYIKEIGIGSTHRGCSKYSLECTSVYHSSYHHVSDETGILLYLKITRNQLLNHTDSMILGKKN